MFGLDLTEVVLHKYAVRRVDGRVALTPGCLVGYVDHTGCIIN
jgi:hypothetical protein